MAKKNSQSASTPTYPGALPSEEITQETTTSQEMINQPEPEPTLMSEPEIEEATPEAIKASDLDDNDPSDPVTPIEEAEPEEKPSETGLTKELFFGRPAEVRKLYPKGCVRWERIFPDLDFNIRDKTDSYSPESLAQMHISLSDFGQEEPMMLSLQDRDDLLKILRGHRRFKSMEAQRNEDLKLVAAGKLDKSQVRWQWVRAEIKTGLTADQEVVLMLDHGQRVGLRPPEIFAATVRLNRMGWTETQCLRKLGFGKEQRSKVASHWKVSTMPKAVQEEYAKYLSGDKNAVKMSAPVVTELYSARTESRKKEPGAFGGGEIFKKAWEKVKAENGNGATRAQGAKKNAESLLDRVESEHPLLVHLVNHILGNKENTPNLDDVVSNISRACNAMFPIDDAEITKVIEEGITREV